MKLTLEEIRGMIGPLAKLSRCDLPIRTAWKLLRISELVSHVNNHIEHLRIDLVKKHGTEVVEVITENGERKVITQAEFAVNKEHLKSFSESRFQVIGEDNLNAFATEFNELLNETTDEPALDELKLSLGDFGPSTEVSAADLAALKKLFA